MTAEESKKKINDFLNAWGDRYNVPMMNSVGLAEFIYQYGKEQFEAGAKAQRKQYLFEADRVLRRESYDEFNDGIAHAWDQVERIPLITEQGDE